jgi:hypothetical protein
MSASTAFRVVQAPDDLHFFILPDRSWTLDRSNSHQIEKSPLFQPVEHLDGHHVSSSIK